MPYVYILECTDSSFYTGSTMDLRKRLKEHEEGRGANYTSKRLPVRLVYYETYARVDVAFRREKQIQGWNRKKKMALINERSEELPLLSRKHFPASDDSSIG